MLRLRNLGAAPARDAALARRPANGLRRPPKFTRGVALGPEYRVLVLPKPDAEPPVPRSPLARSLRLALRGPAQRGRPGRAGGAGGRDPGVAAAPLAQVQPG